MKYSVILVILVSLSGITVAYAQMYSATLTLDPLPSSVNDGDTLSLSGQLTTSDGQYVLPNRTIYIKSENQLALDTSIGYITTDNNGKFSGSWKVISKNDGSDYHIYAVFEGDDKVEKTRSQTFTVSVQPAVIPQTPTPPSQPQQQVKNFGVYAAPLPDYATSYASNVIYDATNAWASANSNIKFYKADTEGQADLDVQWIKEWGTVGGTLGEYVGGTRLIQVGLGDSDCDGIWQPYSTKTVEHIATHEIGHFLGLGHSTDPNNVMYPYTPVEYGQVTIQKSLAAGYIAFIPFCTSKDSTSFSYSVTSDDPTYGFKVYVVPTVSEYNGLKNSLSFNHYSDSGCYGENYQTYSGTCEGVSKGSGLLIVLDNRQTNDLTQLTITQQEVPFTTGTMQTTTSATVTYNYPSKAEETQATIQKAITGAQAALQPQIDAATKAKAEAQAQAASDAQAKSQAEAQAAAASQAQAQAEVQARDAENAKIEAQKQAQEEIAKAKADAEEKITMMSLSNSKKDFYKNQITELKTGIDTTNSSLSKLNFESSAAQEKIKDAQNLMKMAISDYTLAKTNWIDGNDSLNKQDFNASILYFDNMSPNLVSVGNDLASISGLMQDGQNIENDYQKEKHRFCFLFWCW